MAEDGVAGRDAQVTRDGQIEATAEAVPANRSDDWLRGLLDSAHEALAEGGEAQCFDWSERGHFGKVGAGSKTFWSSGENDRGHVRVRLCARHSFGELPEERAGEAREAAGAVERQEKYGVVRLCVYGGVPHSSVRLSARDAGG